MPLASPLLSALHEQRAKTAAELVAYAAALAYAGGAASAHTKSIFATLLDDDTPELEIVLRDSGRLVSIHSSIASHILPSAEGRVALDMCSGPAKTGPTAIQLFLDILGTWKARDVRVSSTLNETELLYFGEPVILEYTLPAEVAAMPWVYPITTTRLPHVVAALDYNLNLGEAETWGQKMWTVGLQFMTDSENTIFIGWAPSDPGTLAVVFDDLGAGFMDVTSSATDTEAQDAVWAPLEEIFKTVLQTATRTGTKFRLAPVWRKFAPGSGFPREANVLERVPIEDTLTLRDVMEAGWTETLYLPIQNHPQGVPKEIMWDVGRRLIHGWGKYAGESRRAGAMYLLDLAAGRIPMPSWTPPSGPSTPRTLPALVERGVPALSGGRNREVRAVQRLRSKSQVRAKPSRRPKSRSRSRSRSQSRSRFVSRKRRAGR